jgi:hypothetical protein
MHDRYKKCIKMLLGKDELVTPLGKATSSIQVSLSTDGRIRFKWNLDKWDVRLWTAS